MKAHVKWVGGDRFLGTSDSGHTMVLDTNGGETAPSPMESLLISLASCSSVDVVSILQKARQAISGCEVEVDASRVDTIPKRFDKIHLHFVVTGKEVSPKQVEKAVKLSADKYCSIAMMINQVVEVTHDFTIVDA